MARDNIPILAGMPKYWTFHSPTMAAKYRFRLLCAVAWVLASYKNTPLAQQSIQIFWHAIVASQCVSSELLRNPLQRSKKIHMFVPTVGHSSNDVGWVMTGRLLHSRGRFQATTTKI